MQIGSEAVGFFYKNVIGSSSYKESDGETELLFIAGSMMHNHYIEVQGKHHIVIEKVDTCVL
jgi:hypothetical protein